MNLCYRMNETGVWWSGGAHVGHTRILDIMEDEIPITSMCGDIMIPHYSFQQYYKTQILARQHWEENEAPVIPENAIAVFTDGSKEPRGTGTGIFFNRVLKDMHIPLGKNASVFQAETYTILQCASILTRNPAKASGDRPYEIGSRNMAATQKINFLTPVSYSLLQTLFH